MSLQECIMLRAAGQKKIYIYIFHPVVLNLKLNQRSKHFVKTANKVLHTKLLLNVYTQMEVYAINIKSLRKSPQALFH